MRAGPYLGPLDVQVRECRKYYDIFTGSATKDADSAEAQARAPVTSAVALLLFRRRQDLASVYITVCLYLQAIRDRCFTRLTPGQLLDTTMDRVPDSVALDTTGDGRVDTVKKIGDK